MPTRYTCRSLEGHTGIITISKVSSNYSYTLEVVFTDISTTQVRACKYSQASQLANETCAHVLRITNDSQSTYQMIIHITDMPTLQCHK